MSPIAPESSAFAAPLPTLPPGALVGVVAPAGPAPEEKIARIPATLEAMGYRARLYPSCQARKGFLSGDDALRATDLEAAFTDPEIAAVFSVRGGYGSGRLLDRVAWPRLLAQPKPFVGYSDLTALQAQFTNAGRIVLHGPMLASDLVDSPVPPDQLGFGILRNGLRAGTRWAPAREASLFSLPGTAEGRVIGGNLSLIASLLGTPYALDVRGGLLFLEEIGEAPYRVDRLLQQLRHAGVLAEARGFILGRFSGTESPADVLADYLAPLGRPVLSGWPAGHGPGAQILPLGAHVTMDASAGSLTFRQDVLAPAAGSGHA
ncbi:MAG: LD-carboxypeptidase [Verrucomicrobia bacterium]|nr:LD-carboxypeptidase [Verrucomicrobiota bacterium]